MDRNEFINRLFETARRKAGNAPDFACEACYGNSESFEVQVKNGEIYQYNVSEGGGLGFRALVNGRMGYASTQILDEDAIDMLVDGALENAAVVESEDRQFLFGGSERYPELKLYEPRLDEIDAAQKIEMAKRLERLTLAQDKRIAQVEDCALFSEKSESAIVNTLGLNVSTTGNLLGGYVSAVARDGEKVQMDCKYNTIEQAIEALRQGKIILCTDDPDRENEGDVMCAAECVTLMDDPHRPGSASSTPFDGEGVATAPKAVIRDGVLTTLLHNLKTAHKQGVTTTANASRPGYASPVGVAPTNFYFMPADADFDAMLEKLGDGLLITDLQGMHAGANPITGDFSLAAKGFRVKGGKLAGAVNQITVAGNIYDLLMGIEAVGGDLEFHAPGGSCFGSPSLLVKALSVAGA